MSAIKKYKKPLIATAAVVGGYLVYKAIKNSPHKAPRY